MIRRFALVFLVAAVVGGVVAGGAFAAAPTAKAKVVKKATKPKAIPEQIVRASVLGIPPASDLIGPQASTDITLPGTSAASWSSLVIIVDWPVQISSGVIDATDSTGRLSVLHAQSDVAVPQRWVIPLHASRGRPYTITLSSTLAFRQTNSTCGASVSGVGPRLRIAAIGLHPYNGKQTIGTYLTGAMKTLTLRLPTDPPHDIQQAALRVEAAVVARDLDRDVSVRIVTTDFPTGKPGLFDRVVTFDPSAPAGLVLDDSGLTISGRNAGLDRQVTLLSSKLIALLQTERASTINIPGIPHIRSGTLSLSQLGITQLITSGAGKFHLPLGFDQAQTGGEDATLRVFLHGTNEAPANGTGATLTLLDGDVPVASTPLSAAGGWQMQGVVPSSTLFRFIDLTLQASYFGGEGSCNSLLPLSVSIDPSSSVRVTSGEPETLPGFLELPQVFLPHCVVVLSSPTFENLQRAAQLVAGVQRMTSVPLTLDLSSAPALPGNQPSIIVAEGGSRLAAQLRPATVTNGSAQFTTAGGITAVSVGSQEAILTAGRGTGQGLLALVTSQGDPTSGDRLLGALGSRQARWLALSGDTAALAPDRVIATAQVNVPLRATIATAGKAWFSNRWVIVVIAVAGLLALLVASQEIARRRRLARAPKPDDDQQP
jgi:hypothetical protein